MVEHGWKESLDEPCRFKLRDKTGQPIGLLRARVDDLFVTGKDFEFDNAMDTIKANIRLTFKRNKSCHCGQEV